MDALPPRLVLFDGVCGLCARSVQLLLDHDPEGRFVFSPLQGERARALRARHPELPEDLDSIIYVESYPAGGERLSYRSRAIFRICLEMPAPYRWLAVFRVLPSALPDLVYRMIASVRYRVWGKRDICRVPSEEERSRFLD